MRIILIKVYFLLFLIQAGSFASILKEEYESYTKECGDAAESLCGIAIVHYDLAMSNVGLKGLGFFTVSYQFITTVSKPTLPFFFTCLTRKDKLHHFYERLFKLNIFFSS